MGIFNCSEAGHQNVCHEYAGEPVCDSCWEELQMKLSEAFNADLPIQLESLSLLPTTYKGDD